MDAKVENNVLKIALDGRIDSNNAGETEKEILEIWEANTADSCVIDVEHLEYISSAGLRVLMKLRKKSKKPLDVINASNEVYDIFQVTGFTELLNVKKKLREVSVEGCEMIGSGGYGKVYRIDPETIVKLYNPGISAEFVEGERAQAQKTFLLGVPTAISYDVVRCGDCYGLVFEMLNADTVAHIISSDSAKVSEYAGRMAELIKELHKIEVQEGELPDRREKVKEWVNTLKGFLTDEEIDKILFYLSSIPKRQTFLHGDFHTKNVMEQNGELVLIDVGDAAVGHPIFDIAQMYLCYGFLADAVRQGRQPKELIGFPVELAEPMWRGQIKAYFGLSDEEEIDKKIAMIFPLACLLAAYHGLSIRGEISDDMKRAILDGLLCKQGIPAMEKASEVIW